MNAVVGLESASSRRPALERQRATEPVAATSQMEDIKFRKKLNLYVGKHASLMKIEGRSVKSARKRQFRLFPLAI